MNRAMWLVLVLCLSAGTGLAGEFTGTHQSRALYTQPDPESKGGIQGAITRPTKPLVGVFAVAQQDQGLVYKADITQGGTGFSFRGLPVGKYDLVVVYGDEFFEGLMLTRGEDSLSQRDHAKIKEIIMVSVPFFDTKEIHRCMGTTGKEGNASAVLQEVRTRPVTLQDASVHSEIQIRSIKLAMLDDVGEIGWALTNTREIIRTEVGPKDTKGILSHHYCPDLSSIRVVDSVKELPDIALR